ncbi:hypothetical protein P152DRAFT_455115 [Eremomyces bilateralis CBS 781.70]|uniref:Uncharacterized protein n=1 Tax=Eremomyces bilateralis CBS 781.70 TaxID=1392243 RepID=A0A6G1GBY7_9PEZI|nr:uncharacterized protein P152DRAFT_455115 [Eremomyces bilateralis CBS 781.70]KAF1815410.1 hypothetical protein P152DRAFT_455115 [Eremomyces bilateralis CBS 781.70]
MGFFRKEKPSSEPSTTTVPSEAPTNPEDPTDDPTDDPTGDAITTATANPANPLDYPATQVFYADPSFPEPPELNYDLRSRKKALIFFWSLVIVDCVFVPIALYFGLFYGTSLSHNAVFSISTATLGTVSIVEYFLRFHRLFRKGSKCRVIGSHRWYLDWFHWNLSLGWIAVMIELIVGTVPHEPPIRLLAMPVSSMLYALAVEMLIVDVLRYFKVRAPVRVSSLPRGAELRPGLYAFIEDVVAVDGSGGAEYRQRLNVRYLSSHYFRVMLHRLTLFWAFGAIGVATLTTILIFTLQKDAAYVVGWTVPFIWAGIWSWITVPYVKRSLKREREIWKAERRPKA